MKIVSLVVPGTCLIPAVMVLAMMAAASARADGAPYNKVVNPVVETTAVRAEHGHDWGRATSDARFKMILTTRDPFSTDNNYAFLRLVDRVTGAQIFRRPVPALSHIWISDFLVARSTTLPKTACPSLFSVVPSANARSTR